MEKLGYVTRRQVAANRKNVYVHLTPKGRALEARLVPLAEQVNRRAVRGLRPAEVHAARRVLLSIIGNLSPSTISSPRAARAPRRARHPD